jgi:hypothetical protein
MASRRLVDRVRSTPHRRAARDHRPAAIIAKHDATEIIGKQVGTEPVT